MLGGVSERAGARAGGSNLSAMRKQRVPSRVVTVESILVCWTAALFAGRRQRVNLGRSAGCVGYLPACWRADDSGCSKDAEEGNDVKHAPQSVCARRKHERSLHALTRTRPSLGPSARARQSSLRTRRKSSGGAYESASRLGKPGEPGGTSTGVGTNGRSATRRMSPSRKRRAWHVEKRKAVEAVVPTRIRESRFGCPHVEVQLQKSVGGVWSRISSAYALQKERSGSSERGPSTE
jgi:hypothetical protein